MVQIVTGFLGKGVHTGAITTLGRGGSDLTATLIGAALDLPEVQVGVIQPFILLAVWGCPLFGAGGSGREVTLAALDLPGVRVGVPTTGQQPANNRVGVPTTRQHSSELTAVLACMWQGIWASQGCR